MSKDQCSCVRLKSLILKTSPKMAQEFLNSPLWKGPDRDFLTPNPIHCSSGSRRQDHCDIVQSNNGFSQRVVLRAPAHYLPETRFRPQPVARCNVFSVNLRVGIFYFGLLPKMIPNGPGGRIYEFDKGAGGAEFWLLFPC